ncbi:MAG: DUF177 domain-containing protein [Deltaproteobacteria bacterium]|nr:DUF177 domain-containing protein [Deltaproteobacteria bacterium]
MSFYPFERKQGLKSRVSISVRMAKVLLTGFPENRMLTIKVDDIPDEGLELKWKEEPETLSGYLEELSEHQFEFDSPLESEANIRKIGGSVFIKGGVQTVLRMHCVRCLKEISHPFSSGFEMVLQPFKGSSLAEETELSSKELESNFFEGGEIHLSEIACEQVFLEVPIQPLCQEECKGLCPKCGKDLNISSCDCIKEEFEAGFNVLKKLKVH